MRSMETQALGDIRIDRIVEFETPIFSPISFFDKGNSRGARTAPPLA